MLSLCFSSFINIVCIVFNYLLSSKYLCDHSSPTLQPYHERPPAMTSSRFDGCQNPSDKQPSTNNIVPSTNTSNHSANNNNTPTTSTADDSLENQAKAKPKRRSVVNPKRSKLAPGPRQETAKTRKDHACDDCRARKVRVSIHLSRHQL